MRGRVLTATALATGIALATSATAAAANDDPGTRSLATVLTSDGNQFDNNPNDFDIVTEAALGVLATKPNSAVSVLTKGEVALTAFVPTDRAFRALAKDVTGQRIGSEKKVFEGLVAAVGIDTIEQVLLYHVVPGKTITAATALHSDGAELNTALGKTVTVDVMNKRHPRVQLVDLDPNDRNAFLDRSLLDINNGNAQIAHGVTAVLRPADL